MLMRRLSGVPSRIALDLFATAELAEVDHSTLTE